MKIEYFEKLLKGNNAISISDDLIIFSDFELYSFSTREGKQYRNIQELCEANPGIKEIIETTESFFVKFDGGRGAGSGNGKMGGGFNHAPGGGGKGYDEKLLNAQLNINTDKKHSIDAVLGRFQQKYGNADREYGIAVDDLGYVHEHIKGGATSVGVSGGKGQTIIHNHPSGGNFSDSDLLAVASTNNKGIIATSSNTDKKATYKFEKTNKFDSKGFIKAVKKAQWPTSMSYDKGADWWLKKNADKYGYKYSSSGVPKK